jgi:formylglycine-generating enzyme required for sulfatase activity
MHRAGVKAVLSANTLAVGPTDELLRARSADMIWIPGGTFRMGSDKHYPEETPSQPRSRCPHALELSGNRLNGLA